MYVKLVGPGEGQESEHNIDGATAVFLWDQLWRKGSDRKLLIDQKWYGVERAQVQLITTGPEITGILTLAVVDADPPEGA